MHRLSILNAIEVPVWVFDVDSLRIKWANPSALDHWNSPSLDELCSRELSNDMSATVRMRLQQYRTDCETTDETFYDEWTIYPNNTPKTIRLALSKYILEDNRSALLIQVLGAKINASPSALHSMQALLHTSTMISVFNDTHELIYANPAARLALGKSQMTLSDYLVERTDLETILGSVADGGSCTVEFPVNTTNGQCWHTMNIEACPDPVTARRTYLVSATDVTEKRRIQQETIDQAYRDPLTGLPNRLSLLEDLRERTKIGTHNTFAVLFLDLDRFKLINDTLGHQIGDSLLVATAERLQSVGGHNSTVARLSGDEFVIILSNADRSYVDAKLQEILKLAHTPLKIDGYNLRVTPSIGVSLYPQDGTDDTTLLQHADIAMYTAKSLASGYQYFNATMGNRIKKRLSLEADLAEAIATNQFELYYQPKINARNFKIVELEALIRWAHPTRGIVSPLDFIPIAEENGMIFDIGDWVLNQALSDQSRWQRSGYNVSVAVNVSPKQFTSPDFLFRVKQALKKSDCSPHMLNLEVTESSLIGDEQNVQNILNQLSADGIKISIDDFGTGYSNLANLHKYPIHCLKIDRAFLNDSNDKELLTTILEMGRVMNLTVVAEGVESDEQIQWLRQHNCDQLQGYYFSKPVPYNDAVQYLSKYSHSLQQESIAA